MNIKMSIHGNKELSASLQRKVANVDRRKVVKALSPSARIVKSALKKAAPVGNTGNLKKSISMKTLPNNPPAISVRPDYRKGGSHVHFIEGGTRHRIQKKTRRSTGSAPANPFIRRAYNSVRALAASRMVSEMKKLVGVA